MDTVKISFCNSNGFSISNNRHKSEIIGNIKKKYGCDVYSNNTRIYNDYILDILKKNKYLLCCLITTARPYVLYFTKIYNDDICLLIDLKIKDKCSPNIIIVPLSIDYNNYRETLLLGDLYKNNKTYKWEFQIEKCLIYRGRLLNSNNQIKNLTLCNDVLTSIRPNILTPFNMKLKEFCSISDIENLVKKNIHSTSGFKIYGLKTTIVYYFNKRYIPNTKYISIKLQNYKLKPPLEKDKKDILKTFTLDEKDTHDDSENLLKIIENDIDIEREFILTMKKTDTYGIFEVFSGDICVGISRINTIELQNIVIDLFKSMKNIKVNAYYNYNFDKWNIESIIEYNCSDSDYSEIQKHISLLTGLSKPNYVLENC